MRPSASLLSVAALATAGLIAAAGTSQAANSTSQRPALEAADLTEVSAADNSDLTGSIVFIRNHNVWVMRPDGTGKFQVTKDGTASSPWSSPSMSDAGIIAAAKGETVAFMRQNGTLVNSMRIPKGHLFIDPGVHLTPVTDAEISPDGSKLAYTQLRQYIDFEGKYRIHSSTSVTDTTALSNITKYGLANGRNGTWVSNNRMLLADGVFELASLGQLDSAPKWFASDEVFDGWYSDPWDQDLSPDRKVMAVSERGFVAFLSVSGDPRTSTPPAPKMFSCVMSNPDDKAIEAVAFDPSSDAAVISTEDAGVEVIRGLKSLSLSDPNCSQSNITASDVDATGSAPHWSPAPLNTSGGGGGTGSTFSVVAAPKVTGTAKVGRTLSATKGTWNPAPATTSYQWLRSGKTIKGATKSTYKLAAADKGKKVSVKVTARKSGYSTRSATSSAVTVKPGTFTVKAAPKISGTARAGQTLRTTKGAWSPTPSTTRYQWLRSGKTIKGATKATYKLTRTDRGKRITVKVTASKSGYTTRSATSKAVTVRR
ncbi:hypothetical protein [Kribbia dieselivorans]|uniref:hypothetical protein n=1 Tax=Kribbia dieselivorans TaxID=331526 RepID=UPI0008397E0B|nr:hypothetical protein [Kribbia dieselivorans]